MKIVAIDFETANNSMASACAIGISVLVDGVVDDEYYTLIKPHPDCGRFNNMNIKIHGIMPRDVEDAPTFADIYDTLQSYFDDAIICAHNAPFDISVLNACCYQYGLPIFNNYYFDTVELSRKYFANMKHHRLNDMSEHLNVDLDHHNAASDAGACLAIVINVMNLTGIYDIDELLLQSGMKKKLI